MTSTPPGPREPDPAPPGWAAPSRPAPASGPPTTPPGATTSPATAGGWASPPPLPAKRKLTWLWILIGALGVILVLVVVAVVLFIRNTQGPIDATNVVLRAVKAGDYATAYEKSCSVDRDTYTEDQYAQAFEDIVSARGRIVRYDVNYSSVHGSRAQVAYDLEFAGGDKRRPEATVRKEGGRWRACLFHK